MAAAVWRPPHSGRYRIPGGCGEKSAQNVSARNPPVCPALQPPPCAWGTWLPRRRPCLGPSHLAGLSGPRSLSANPRQSLPQPPWENTREKVASGSWVSRSTASLGSETRAPGTLRAPLSPVSSVARTKRGVTNPRYVGEGTGEAHGPQSEYYGNPGSSALIRSAPYLVPSLPGMTREGEEKPGKAPELDRGPHPLPRRAPPSYLVPKRSLGPWG